MHKTKQKTHHITNMQVSESAGKAILKAKTPFELAALLKENNCGCLIIQPILPGKFIRMDGYNQFLEDKLVRLHEETVKEEVKTAFLETWKLRGCVREKFHKTRKSKIIKLPMSDFKLLVEPAGYPENNHSFKFSYMYGLHVDTRMQTSIDNLMKTIFNLNGALLAGTDPSTYGLCLRLMQGWAEHNFGRPLFLNHNFIARFDGRQIYTLKNPQNAEV